MTRQQQQQQQPTTNTLLTNSVATTMMITIGRHYNHCRRTLRWVSYNHHQQGIRVVDGRSMSSFSHTFRRRPLPHFTPALPQPQPQPHLLPQHSVSFATDANITSEDDAPKHPITPWAEPDTSNRQEHNLKELAHVVEQVLYHMAHESKYRKATDNPQRLVPKTSSQVTPTDTTTNDSIDTRAYILELADGSEPTAATTAALATPLRQVLMAVPHALDHIANTISWFNFDDAAAVAALPRHDTTTPDAIVTTMAQPRPPRHHQHIKRTIRRIR